MTRPVQLHCDLSVDPTKEAELVGQLKSFAPVDNG
jgi:hypothetical protein